MMLRVGIVLGISFLIISSTVLQNKINIANAESNSPVEFLDIHTEPSVVHVGNTFRINATIINNTPNTITFPSECGSSLSAVFDSNVVVPNIHACVGVVWVELKAGEKISILGSSSGIRYRASDAGITNAKITFTYTVQNESKSVSKPFVFTIREGIQNVITAKLNTRFQLKIGQTALIESKNISVKFLNVTEDSRCPSDVVCVWEGQVTILLNMHNDQDLGDLALTIRGGQTLAATTFDGYSIQLMQVEPYPKASEPTQRPDYVATLLVSKITSSESNSERVYVKAIRGKDLNNVENYNTRVLASLDLSEMKGIVLLLRDGSREMWHIAPTFPCTDLVNSNICIESPAKSDKPLSMPTSLRVEVDTNNLKLSLTLPSENAKFAFDIRDIKTSENGAVSEKSTVVLKEGQRDGPLLVQKIYPDRIEGLNFIEYPLAREEGIPTTLHIGETASNGCTVKLTLLEIHDKVATFLKTVDTGKPCPICWHNKN